MNALIVEDDELLAEFTSQALHREGHFVTVCHDGLDSFKKAKNQIFDVIVLDILLPRKDGISICKDLHRLKISTPIIILSSQFDETTKVEALNSGADDYLVKPFSHKELIARVRAITRRPSIIVQSKLRIGDLELDPEGHVVKRAGNTIPLRPKEYELLEFMMRNPDIVLPKHLLLNKVWGIRSESASNRLEVYIKFLREKIDKPFKSHLITTVHGIGYRLHTVK